MIKFNKYMGLNTYDLEQGTNMWLMSRAGVITASNAYMVIMPDKLASMPDDVEIKKGEKRGVNSVEFKGELFTGTQEACKNFVRNKIGFLMPDMKNGYMLELIAQVCTGQLASSLSFKQAEWGHENEPLARSAYEASEFAVVEECGLFYKDESLRVGISPDGLINSDKQGLEIKCPFTTQVHINTLLNKVIKPEYIAQIQFSMWASGYERWDFCSYDHRMRGNKDNRLCIIPQYPDNEYFDKFEVEIPKFIEEMNERLDTLGFEFGQQWQFLDADNEAA